MASPETAERRAEELAGRVLPERTPKLRMLVIVNPYATTVSDRLKNLVVYALQARYEVRAIETTGRGHATELAGDATREGFDVVVAFGGDGTINEAANGLARSRTPLTALPGGSTNVFCRVLGIPNDVVDATEHLLAMADRFEPRRMDLGRANDRLFTFASGVGLDASVVERVDRRPLLKARAGEWFYAYAAISSFARRYLVNPPRLRVEAGGRTIDGVTAVIQSCDPFTFFGPRPIRVSRETEADSGAFGLTVLRKATPLEIPSLSVRLLSSRASWVLRHRQVEGLAGLTSARVASADDRRLPVQVDGDHIGELSEIEYGVEPRGLTVVS
jgi:diacylglycerol kinase family enzyme